MPRLLARLPSGTQSLKESGSESCAGTVIVVDSSDEEIDQPIAVALRDACFTAPDVMDRPLLWL